MNFVDSRHSSDPLTANNENITTIVTILPTNTALCRVFRKAHTLTMVARPISLAQNTARERHLNYRHEGWNNIDLSQMPRSSPHDHARLWLALVYSGSCLCGACLQKHNDRLAVACQANHRFCARTGVHKRLSLPCQQCSLPRIVRTSEKWIDHVCADWQNRGIIL